MTVRNLVKHWSGLVKVTNLIRYSQLLILHLLNIHLYFYIYLSIYLSMYVHFLYIHFSKTVQSFPFIYSQMFLVLLGQSLIQKSFPT